MPQYLRLSHCLPHDLDNYSIQQLGFQAKLARVLPKITDQELLALNKNVRYITSSEKSL